MNVTMSEAGSRARKVLIDPLPKKQIPSHIQ